MTRETIYCFFTCLRTKVCREPEGRSFTNRITALVTPTFWAEMSIIRMYWNSGYLVWNFCFCEVISLIGIILQTWIYIWWGHPYLMTEVMTMKLWQWLSTWPKGCRCWCHIFNTTKYRSRKLATQWWKMNWNGATPHPPPPPEGKKWKSRLWKLGLQSNTIFPRFPLNSCSCTWRALAIIIYLFLLNQCLLIPKTQTHEYTHEWLP